MPEGNGCPQVRQGLCRQPLGLLGASGIGPYPPPCGHTVTPATSSSEAQTWERIFLLVASRRKQGASVQGSSTLWPGAQGTHCSLTLPLF